jgi:hypothetical protein
MFAAAVNEALRELEELGFRVGWGTVLVGLIGPGSLLPQLSPIDATRFATSRLSEIDRLDDEVVDLSYAAPPDRASAIRLVSVLAEREGAQRELDERRWRALLLVRELRQHPMPDPLQGLLALTEFWSGFDFPRESPHVVPGRGNAIHPRDYYTPETYASLLERHHGWLQAELASLRASNGGEDAGPRTPTD